MLVSWEAFLHHLAQPKASWKFLMSQAGVCSHPCLPLLPPATGSQASFSQSFFHLYPNGSGAN